MGYEVIREIEADDVSWVVSLGRQMWLESTFSNWCDWDDASTERHICRLMADDNSVILVDSDQQGFLGGYVRPVYFNNNTTQLIEDTWYVAPEKRRSVMGARLLQKFIQWGAEKGAVSVLLSDRAMIEPRQVQKMMSAFGFHVDGISYRRTL